MFLEEWIHAKVQQGLEENPKYRAQMSSIKFSRAHIEEYQLLKLKKTLDYVCKNSSFYQGLLNKAKIKPSDIQSLEDLANIPFTEQSDLADSPYKFLCISLGAVGRIYTLNTGGTTGAPKRVFFSEEDMDEITDYMGAAMKTVATLGGAGNNGYTVAILLPNGERASQASLLARGIEKHGGIPTKIDITLDNQHQFGIIKELRPDIVFGSVFRLWRLTQDIRQSHDLTKIGVKILFLTSEYLSEVMRQELRNAWASDVYCHYGMTEMGFGGSIECDVHDGFHFNEADFLFEVVNQVTGQTLELGEEGELVLTTLSREGMPLIRYRTGDLSRLIAEHCTCGARVLHRTGRVTKRTASIVRLGTGDEIYPSIFSDVVFAVPEVIDYQTVLSNDGRKDNLVFQVEITIKNPGIEQELAEKLSTIPVIAKSINLGAMALPRVELVEQGSLRRQGRAKKLITDQR